MAHTLTDGERDILNEQNRDAAADAQAEWEALTPEEQDAAIAAADAHCRRLDVEEARARECARLDIAAWESAANDYEAWLDAQLEEHYAQLDAADGKVA